MQLIRSQYLLRQGLGYTAAQSSTCRAVERGTPASYLIEITAKFSGTDETQW
jgi:6-phosphogluconate dehydrogenase